MSSTTTYAITKPEIIREQFDEEVVIVDLDTGSYYSLSGAGGEVWSAIENKTPVAGIAQQLIAAYDAQPDEIEASLGRLLGELEVEGLITPQSDGDAVEQALAPTDESQAKSPWQAPILQKFTDMQALLLLDPIHEVDSAGWPQPKPEEPAATDVQPPHAA